MRPITSRTRSNEKSLLKNTDHDRRWIKIRRPTVIVGGELTMDCPGDPARSGEQCERSPAAAQEQLRLPADRRLWPPADRADGAAESLDRAAGEPAGLSHDCDGQEDPGSL